MGMFDGALSALEGIVGDGASEHSGLLREAIRHVEADPGQFAGVLGRLTNHPEIAGEVTTWMGTPQAQALLSHVASRTDEPVPAAAGRGSYDDGDAPQGAGRRPAGRARSDDANDDTDDDRAVGGRNDDADDATGDDDR